MFLARRLGEIWWIPGAAVVRRDRRRASRSCSRISSRDDGAPTIRPCGARPTSSSASRVSRAFPSRSRTSAARRARRTPTPSASEPRARSSSGARWSTAASPTQEVRVVLAHEIGHHSSNHIPKALAWFALFALPGRLGADAGDAATRRDGRGGGGAAGAARRRRDPARARTGPGLDQPPDGGRGRLEGAPDDPRPRGRARPLRRLRRDVARRSRPARAGRTSCSTAIRRWRSASRWRRRGSGSGRRSVSGEAEASPRRSTSTCTRARSRPRAASGGRRAR